MAIYVLSHISGLKIYRWPIKNTNKSMADFGNPYSHVENTYITNSVEVNGTNSAKSHQYK